MSSQLQIFLIIAVVAFLVIILFLIRNGKMKLKYSLIWLFAAIVILIVAVFPEIIYNLASLVGIEAPVNFVYVIEGIFVILILLYLTVIVSKMSARINRLTQTLARLEKRVRDIESSLEDDPEDRK